MDDVLTLIDDLSRSSNIDWPTGNAVSKARKEIVQLRAALKVTHQALLEVAHAQKVGTSWYTRGERGLRGQVEMWVRRGLAAIADAGQ